MSPVYRNGMGRVRETRRARDESLVNFTYRASSLFPLLSDNSLTGSAPRPKFWSRDSHARLHISHRSLSHCWIWIETQRKAVPVQNLITFEFRPSYKTLTAPACQWRERERTAFISLSLLYSFIYDQQTLCAYLFRKRPVSPSILSPSQSTFSAKRLSLSAKARAEFPLKNDLMRSLPVYLKYRGAA